MSIIFVGNDPAEFDGDFVGSTTTGSIDAAYSRIGITLGNGYVKKTLPASHSELWFSFRRYINSGGVTSSRMHFEIGTAAQGVVRVALDATPSYRLERWNGTAWVAVGSTVTLPSTSRVTLRAKLAVAGVISLYIDEALVASYEGDTSALPLMNRVFIQSPSTSGSIIPTISEVIVASHNVVSARLKALAITANGANAGWSGSYLDIDAATETNSSFISSETAGQKSTFVVGDLPTDSLVVDSVVVSGVFRRNATGPSGIKALARVGGVDYGQTLDPLLESFGLQQSVFSVNPATAAPWEKAAVNALEIGVESVA